MYFYEDDHVEKFLPLNGKKWRKIMKNEKKFLGFKPTRLLTNESGFTLIELMVVVAIIALLAATALPQFRKYQAKSRTSEAKLALAGIYTAEESYYAEYNHYYTCLGFMGFIPSGTSLERYYYTGFSDLGAAHAQTPTACSGTASAPALSYFYAGEKGPGSVSITSRAALSYSYVSSNHMYFTAGASGIVDKDFTGSGLMSKFLINNEKAMTMTQVGY